MSKIVLKYLKIKNFASYKDAELNFTDLDYPVFIVGDNGAGKTTLFVDAISYALFGRAYGDVRFRKDLIASFHDINLPTEVVLKIDYGGAEYRIIRRSGVATENILHIKYGDGSSKLYTSRKEVDKVVEELLGLNYENMLETFIVRQGQLTSFINLKPSERRGKLVEMLNINFREIRERVKEDLKNVQTRKVQFQSVKSRIKEDFERAGFKDISSKVVDEKIIEVNKEINEKKNLINKLKMEFTKLDREKEKLISLRNTLNNIKERISTIESKIESLRASIYSIVKDNIRIEDLPELIERLNTIYKQIEPNLKRLELLERIRGHLEETQEISREISSIETDLDRLKDIDKLNGELRAKLVRYTHRLEVVRHNLQLIKEGEGRCPLCGSILTDEHRERLIRSFKDEEKKLNEEIKEISVELEKVRNEVKRKKELEDKIATFKGKISILTRELEKELKEIDEKKKLELEDISDEILWINERIDNIKGFLDSLKTQFNLYLKIELEDWRNIEEIIKRLEHIYSEYNQYVEQKEEELDRFKKQLESSDFINEEEIESRFREVDDAYKKLLDKINNLNQEVGKLEELEKNFLHLKKEAEEYITISKELEELEKEELILTKLSDEIFIESGFPLYYLQLLVNKYLSEAVNRYLRKIYPDMGVNYKAGKTGIELEIYVNGRKRELATLSGGEATILGLATRLALGELLLMIHSKKTRPGFLIIDEGFGPLDEDNRLKISEIFRELVDSSLYPQLIVISHEREMMDSNYFNSIIEVYKERGYSKVELRRF